MKQLTVFLFLITFHAFGQDHYRDNEVLIKFDWRLLDLDVIDDEKYWTEALSQFLKQDAVQVIQDAGFSTILDNDCRKVFPFLKTTDTVSAGRLGNKVYIPTFWAWFNLNLDGEYSVEQFCRLAIKMSDLVLEVHPNFTGEFQDIPDDTLFYKQQSLLSSTFPNSDIDVDSIWDITTGEPWVKVGIFDTGIDSLHPDIKLLGGKGYYIPFDFPSDTHWGDPGGIRHGTKVAGVIGAKRNNTTGIAGIAGGNGSDTTGVSMIDFYILPPGGDIPDVEHASAAIIDAARGVYTYYDWNTYLGNNYFKNSQGWGIWLANHSYSFKIQQLKTETMEDSIIDYVTAGSVACALCIEAYLFSNENNVTNIAARGNVENPTSPDDLLGDDNLWPQTYPDHMIISVGGSGYDGNRWSNLNNTTTEGSWESMTGRDVDLIAPSTDSLVYTTQPTDVVDGATLDTLIPYAPFKGTSAAAPHVVGSVALLLSYYNKPCYSNYNLANEDIEHLLEKSAIDVHAAGYDDESGHGRLNVLNLFDSLRRPWYQVVHPTDAPVSYTVTIHDTVNVKGKNFSPYGPYSSEDIVEPNIITDDEYQTVLYKVDATYDFSSYLTAPDAELLDTWVRINTSTFATPLEDTLDNPDEFGFDPIKKFNLERQAMKVSNTANTITLSGYVYHFIEHVVTETSMDLWYPKDTSQWHFDYSIYIRDTVSGIFFDSPCTDTIILIDTNASVQENQEFDIDVYPNPFDQNFTVHSTNQPISSISVFELTGRLVKRLKFEEMVMISNIGTADLSPGIYIVQVKLVNGTEITRKIVRR